MKLLKVYLSPLAEKKLEMLLGSIGNEWGQKAKYDFLKKLESVVSQISQHPKSCIESKKMPGIFKCIVSSQTSIFYRINFDSIEIITVVDNRQDSRKILKEIRKYFS